MAYVKTEVSYGTRPWQLLHLYQSDTVTAGARPWILYVPGGGWGLRSPIGFDDPTNGSSPDFFAGALARVGSPNLEKYSVAVVQVASNSHQTPTPGSLTTHPVWADATAYAFDDFVQHSGQTYQCMRAHTSDATGTTGNTPGSGDADAVLCWYQVTKENVGQPLIEGRGESQNGYAAQAVADIHQAVAYLLQNATVWNLSPTKFAGAGDSAGGFDVARAVSHGSIPFAAGDHPTGSHPSKASVSTQFKAVIPGIAPTHIHEYITTDRGGSQGLLLGALASLYGRRHISQYAEWEALPEEIKKSLDPLMGIERTKETIPTYLRYSDDNSSDFTNLQTNTIPITDADVFNGYTRTNADGSTSDIGPNAHHARNGLRYLRLLAGDVADGRLGRTDCVFLEKGTATDTLLRWTQHPSDGGTATTLPYTDPTKKEIIGEDIMTWLNGVLNVT